MVQALGDGRLPGSGTGARRGRGSRHFSRSATQLSRGTARLSSTSPRSSPAWRTSPRPSVGLRPSPDDPDPPGSVMERARAGSRESSSPAERVKNSTTSSPVSGGDEELHAVRERLERAPRSPGGGFDHRDLRSRPGCRASPQRSSPGRPHLEARVPSPVGGTAYLDLVHPRRVGGPRRHQATKASTASRASLLLGPPRCRRCDFGPSR